MNKMRHSALLTFSSLIKLVTATIPAKNIDFCPWRSTVLLGGQLLCPAPWRSNLAASPKEWEWVRDRSEAWDGPFHCIEDFCVFVNRRLNGGLVLISRAKDVHAIDSFPVGPTPSAVPPSFHATEVPGKGIGLIATRDISRGEIVMQHPPVMLIHSTPHRTFDPDVRLQLYRTAAEMLPEKNQRLFMRQYGQDEFLKVEKNAFRLFIDRGEDNFYGHLGVYPVTSQMNHDCRPNTIYRITNITHVSVAARSISAGEELTISYIDMHLPHAERQSRLRDWGFNCACSHCTMPEKDVEASDSRIAQIASLQERLEDMVGSGKRIDPSVGAELIRLYEEDRLDIVMGAALTRTALLYSLVGMEEETREYARRAEDALRREKDSQHSDVQAMKALADNPMSHWSWAKRVEARKGNVG